MNIVPRDVWCPIRPNGTPRGVGLPLPRTWLHHGATGTPTVQTAIAYARYHIQERGWLDVGYSFLIAEGKVLEGRGAGREGAHTSGENSHSHGICMVGNYSAAVPSDADLDALTWLLRHGTGQGWWRAPTLTGGHRDAPGARTTCPGTALHRLIPTINEGDDMNAEDRKLLQETALSVARIEKALDERGIGNDLRRTRLTVRAIAAKVGLATEHDVPDGPVSA